MNLCFELLTERVEIKQGQICILTIENTDEYRHVVQGLIHGNLLVEFYSDNELLENKYIEFIPNIYQLDMNEKKVVTRILKHLESYMKDDWHLPETMKMQQALAEYLENIIFDSGIPLEISDEIDLQTLLKASGIKVREESESFLENFINYLELILNFTDTKVFIFVNLLLFITEMEFAELINFFKQQNLIILDIERSNILPLPHPDKVDLLFDDDLCRVL